MAHFDNGAACNNETKSKPQIAQGEATLFATEFASPAASVLVPKLFQLALLVGRELVFDVYQQRDLGPFHLALH